MQKNNINVAILGHISSGKSTLLSQLLFQAGRLSNIQRESSATLNTSIIELQTDKFQFTFFDTPGHIDHRRNTFQQIAIADVALLVISAAKEEYETGKSQKGSNRDFIIASYSLGVKQMIVAITKLDFQIQNKFYSQIRFEEISNETMAYLNKVGYQQQFVQILPVSGLKGDNIIKSSNNLNWYEGSDLLTTLKNVQKPWRHIEKPFRFAVRKIYQIQGKGIVAGGVVDSGCLKPSQQLQIAPKQLQSTVKSIQSHHVNIQEGKAGDSIGIYLPEISVREIQLGDICGFSE